MNDIYRRVGPIDCTHRPDWDPDEFWLLAEALPGILSDELILPIMSPILFWISSTRFLMLSIAVWSAAPRVWAPGRPPTAEAADWMFVNWVWIRTTFDRILRTELSIGRNIALRIYRRLFDSSVTVSFENKIKLPIINSLAKLINRFVLNASVDPNVFVQVFRMAFS